MKTSNRFGRTRLLGLSLALIAPLGIFSSSAVAAPPSCSGNSGSKAAIQQASNNSAVEGTTVHLNIASSARGTNFIWSYVSGPLVTPSPASGESTSFVLPQVGPGGAVLTVRLTASGCTGSPATATEDFVVNITDTTTPAPNYEPVAVASASPSSANEATTVSLIGSASTDPENDPLTYLWEQTSGPSVTISNATSAVASFVAPSVSSTTTLGFKLTVREATGGLKAANASVSVNVLNVNVPPVASLSCPAYVDEGNTITLDGSASNDPDSAILSYSFAQFSGLPLASIPAGPYGSSVSFPAPSLGLGQTGLVQFTLTVTDGDNASNSAMCSIFISDVTAPVLSGGGNQTLEATSSAGAIASYTVTSYDNVDGAGGATCVPPSGSTFPLGATPVACAQNDSSGNIGELGFTITVRDTTAPVIAAHGDVTEEATSAAGALVSYTAPATSDAVDGAGVATCVPASGSQFPLGTTPVACNATDNHNNAATPTGFNVKVLDRTAPAITAPADITVEATGPLTTVTLVDATATDAVGPVTISSDAPAQFPVGTTLVTWTATDGAMNSSSTTSNVTVTDKSPPVVDPVADQTIEATGPDGADASFTAPTAHDLVDGDFSSTCDHAPGTFALGSTLVTCSATDLHGNTGSTSFTITVEDTTDPVLALPADLTVEAIGPSGAPASFVATATDIVDTNVEVVCTPASGSTFALGVNAVNCSATDDSGNEASGSFNVTVEDTTDPVLTVPADFSVEATGPSGAAVSFAASATDIVDQDVDVSCSPLSGSVLSLGAHVITCTATDDAGNQSSQGFTVTVQDTIAPVLTVPASFSVEATGPAGAVATFSASATDVVDTSVTVVCTPASGSVFALGATTVSCTATDDSGNATSDGFTVTVKDTTAPVIASHADVTAIATSASGAVVNYTLPTATDLVDGSVAVTCLAASGSTFAVGTTTVNCSATDSHGNTGTSSFKVIVSYAFTGFFKPIDNLPIVNVTKAGQAIPVKFSLGGNMGLNIFAAGYPKSIQMACGGSAEDAIEETVTAGGSSLSYDATTGQYIYVWKSDKAWAGTCRQLQVKFADGQVRSANFSFTR